MIELLKYKGNDDIRVILKAVVTKLNEVIEYTDSDIENLMCSRCGAIIGRHIVEARTGDDLCSCGGRWLNV